MSTPSRFEVEHLHRLTMQASDDAAELELQVQRKRLDKGSIADLLGDWRSALDEVETAVARARLDLLEDDTPEEQLDRVHERVEGLRESFRGFDPGDDLEDCVDGWNGLSFELRQLSGEKGDEIARLLERKKPGIDEVIEELFAARAHGGLLEDDWKKLKELERKLDAAREKYARLRGQYLDAERAFNRGLVEERASSPATEALAARQEQPVRNPVAPFSDRVGTAAKASSNPTISSGLAQPKLPAGGLPRLSATDSPRTLLTQPEHDVKLSASLPNVKSGQQARPSPDPRRPAPRAPVPGQSWHGYKVSAAPDGGWHYERAQQVSWQGRGFAPPRSTPGPALSSAKSPGTLLSQPEHDVRFGDARPLPPAQRAQPPGPARPVPAVHATQAPQRVSAWNGPALRASAPTQPGLVSGWKGSDVRASTGQVATWNAPRGAVVQAQPGWKPLAPFNAWNAVRGPGARPPPVRAQGPVLSAAKSPGTLLSQPQHPIELTATGRTEPPARPEHLAGPRAPRPLQVQPQHPVQVSSSKSPATLLAQPEHAIRLGDAKPLRAARPQEQSADWKGGKVPLTHAQRPEPKFDPRVHVQGEGPAPRPGSRPPPHAQQLERPAGPPKVALERVEKVAGYPTAHDGIGKGNQSAHLIFRAEHLDKALPALGTVSIPLGCSVKLDVAPTVTLFSAVPGAPLRGKLSLFLISSGGALLQVPPSLARETARSRARAGAKALSSRLGLFGAQLQGAIAEVLDDAADKIFARAQPGARQQQAPQHEHHRRGRHGSHALEHQVQRFDHVLGALLHEKQEAGRAPHKKHKLHHLIDRERHHRDGVGTRLAQTLGTLATATHRTLTDKHATELRGRLARLDSVLSRIKGKAGKELHEGAHEIGDLLGEMGSIVQSAGGAPHLAAYRRLIDERREQIAKMTGESRHAAAAALPHFGMHLPSAQVLGEKALERLRKLHPGIERLLHGASRSQLAHELSQLGRHGKKRRGRRRGSSGPDELEGALFPELASSRGDLAGLGGLHGGAHLGGFGGGNPSGGLGALHAGKHALARLFAQHLERQARTHAPHDLARVLGDLKRAPKGSPLHDIAVRAEEKRRHLNAKHGGKKGPSPSQVTAQALLQVFRSHGRNDFAQFVAPGGALFHLCEAAQRSHGLPVSQMASHYLSARGHSNIFSAVSTFHDLVAQGNKPRFGFWSHLRDSVSHAASAATGAIGRVGGTLGSALDRTRALASAMGSAASARQGLSSLGGAALRLAPGPVRNLVNRGVGSGRGPFSGAQRAWDRVPFHGMAGNILSSARSLALAAPAPASGRRRSGGFIGSPGGAFEGLGHLGGGLFDRASGLAHASWAGLGRGAGALGRIASSTLAGLPNGLGAALGNLRNAAGGAGRWASNLSRQGLGFIGKTGVVGSIRSGLKTGLSSLGNSIKDSALGRAVSAGYGAAASPLGRIWQSTRGIRDRVTAVANQAWGGIKNGVAVASRFLQSPAGQLLVTSLSVAASFVPGGMLVKALVGGGIGVLQAISEGKSFQNILIAGVGGAVTGALPFMKLGPIARMGAGALTGGIATLASGGSLGDVAKGAGMGVLDTLHVGSFRALGKMKGASAVEKLLAKGALGKLAKGKPGATLRALEKQLANPKMRRVVTGLEQAAGKGVKGGIWLSGKAGKVEAVLDRAVAIGDGVDSLLGTVHDAAPDLAGALGDNVAGRFVSTLGDWSGEADSKLHRAMQYGHEASDSLSAYRGYLDKGLSGAGVKDSGRARRNVMARKHAHRGAAGEAAGLERGNQKAKHSELHAATKRRGAKKKAHASAPPDAHERRQVHGPHGKPAGAHAHDAQPERRSPRAGRHPNPQAALGQALHRLRELQRKGVKLAQGAHDKLGALHELVARGLEGAAAMQSGLEQAIGLARKGAGIVGEDTELGAYLAHVAERADAMNEWIDGGLSYAEDFEKGVGKAEELTAEVPGVHAHGQKGKARRKKGALDEAIHLEGRGPERRGGALSDVSPRGHGPHAGQPHRGAAHAGRPHAGPAHAKPGAAAHGAAAQESEAARDKRLSRAFDKIAALSAEVQKLDASCQERLAKVKALLDQGKSQAAALELQGLGAQVESVGAALREARTLAKGSDQYEKEIEFYQDWQAKARGKVHAAIAEAKGLGAQTQISGFGLDEKKHHDVFANTQEIYAVASKVTAFGGDLGAPEAKTHVAKVLAEARKAKAQLQSLKGKHKGDAKAFHFLADGTQDRLIDEQIAKLEKALKAPRAPKPEAERKPAAQAGPELHGKVHGAIALLEKYKRKTLRGGKKLDGKLGHIEHVLKKGVRAGKKVDAALEQAAGLADELTDLFGADTPLGQLAHEVHDGAQKGHGKLNRGIEVAQRTRSGIHAGRELLKQSLDLAGEHHEKRLPRELRHRPHGVHGPAHAHLPHGAHPPAGGSFGEVRAWWEAQSRGAQAHGPHGHDRRDAHPHGPHGHDRHGAPHLDGFPRLPRGLHVPQLPHSPGELPLAAQRAVEWVTGLFQGAPHAFAPGRGPQPEEIAHEAVAAVSKFASDVQRGIAEVGRLLAGPQAGKAPALLHGLQDGSERCRQLLTAAVAGTAQRPALHGSVLSARDHFLAIRRQLFQFVTTLHGLEHGATLPGLDPRTHPDVFALANQIADLLAKVRLLGPAQASDRHVVATVRTLQTQASALLGRLASLLARYTHDPKAQIALQNLRAQLLGAIRTLAEHGAGHNVSRGDRELGLHRQGPRAPRAPAAPAGRPRRTPRDPLDRILDGDDGRLYVDRHAHRGDVARADGQEVDPSSMDTWVGSGEGVKYFSDVFGAFLPAEGTHKSVILRLGKGGAHGDAQPDLDYVLPHEEPATGEPAEGPRAKRGKRPGPHPHHRKARPGFVDKLKSQFKGGFFKDLFHKLTGFSDDVAQAAQTGEGLLGQARHLAETGLHDLNVVEHYAGLVERFAGKAEDILDKMHLGKAAKLAHKLGSAADFADLEAKKLHGGLKTADKLLGLGKKELGFVEGLGHRASAAFAHAEHGQFGDLLSIFRASKGGDGIDGKLSPDKVRLGSNFDEPRRIDLSTIGRMEGFLGGDFSGVRIHTGPGAAQVTGRFNAEAVTVKDHIFFAPGRYNTSTVEGQKLLAHELTHVMQKGRANLDVRTAEGEALHSEHTFGAPAMETLNLGRPAPDFKLADGEGLGLANGIHTAKRTRSRGHEVGGKDDMPDGDEFMERVSDRVYELLMEELEHSFESR